MLVFMKQLTANSAMPANPAPHRGAFSIGLLAARAKSPRVAEQRPHLARELNAFDATLIVMGGIIGTGIFVNPSVVAARAHTTPLICAAWIVGGIVALFGG